MTEFNEWKIWNGGECPVDPDTMVQVQLDNESRDEVLENGVDKACDWLWGYDLVPFCSRIIAYRTVKEPVVKVREGACFVSAFEGYNCPFFASGPSEDGIDGSFTMELRRGKPFRVVWEADE